MPCFVRQCKNIVEHVGLVIHQNIRVRAERSATERATLLARIGIPIAPTSAQAPREDPAVLVPKGLQGLHNNLYGLIPRAMGLGLREYGNIRIIMMDGIELHLPPPHVEISVDGRQMVSDRCDQIVIDGYRHVVGKEGRLKCARIVPCTGIIDIGMHASCEGRR